MQYALDVMSKMYMGTMPVHIAPALEDYREMLNTSGAGYDPQHVFTNVQVNISPVSEFTNGL